MSCTSTITMDDGYSGKIFNTKRLARNDKVSDRNEER